MPSAALQRVEAAPGVISAAVANYLPLSGHWGTTHFSIEGQPSLAPGDFLVAEVHSVSHGRVDRLFTAGTPRDQSRPRYE